MFAAIVRVYKDLQFGQQLSSNSFVFFITVIPNGLTMTFNILTSGCVVSHCEQTTLNIFFNETFQTSTNSIAITLHKLHFSMLAVSNYSAEIDRLICSSTHYQACYEYWKQADGFIPVFNSPIPVFFRQIYFQSNENEICILLYLLQFSSKLDIKYMLRKCARVFSSNSPLMLTFINEWLTDVFNFAKANNKIMLAHF